MLADLDTRPEFFTRRIKAHTWDPGSVVFLDGLVYLVLLMRTDTKVTPSIIQRVQVNMIDLFSLSETHQQLMKHNTVAIGQIWDSPLSIPASVPPVLLHDRKIDEIEYKLRPIGTCSPDYIPLNTIRWLSYCALLALAGR